MTLPNKSIIQAIYAILNPIARILKTKRGKIDMFDLTQYIQYIIISTCN